MDQENELLASQNEQESVAEESTDPSGSDTQTEEVDVEALKQQNKELFARAKKAEQALRQKPPVEVKKEEKVEIKNESMSLKDIRALQDVDDEDVDEVIDFAKFKGITIAEAKKHPVMQTLLKTKVEERKTAAATNVAPQRRSTKSNVDLVEKARNYELSSDDDMKLAAKQFVQSLKGQK